MMTDAPGGIRRLTSCRPTTAGTPSDRARMAVWYVRLPASVAKPRIRVQSSCATTDGVSSSAMSTHGVSRSWSRSRAPPFPSRRFIRSRPATSCRSPLRSWRYGILDVVEDRRDLVQRALDRPFGVDALLAEDGGRASDEHRVVQHQELRVEDGGEIRALQLGDPRADLLQLLARPRRAPVRAPTSSRATRSGEIGNRMTCVR